ncbi:hypothetical protein CO614_11210 [Lysobacteraceae bacterium NML120232]|nr:hypothetical protein CO614_11210 [Xanthomonadaceae bacterium NML120232]
MEPDFPSYFAYWGKATPPTLPQTLSAAAYHLLPFHALDVAACGAQLLKLPRFSLAALYDLGKRMTCISPCILRFD